MGQKASMEEPLSDPLEKDCSSSNNKFRDKIKGELKRSFQRSSSSISSISLNGQQQELQRECEFEFERLYIQEGKLMRKQDLIGDEYYELLRCNTLVLGCYNNQKELFNLRCKPTHRYDITPNEKRQVFVGFTKLFEQQSTFNFVIAKETDPLSTSSLPMLPLLASSFLCSFLLIIGLTDDEDDKYHYDQLKADANQMKVFSEQIVETVAQVFLKTESKEDVIITNVQKGSIKIEVMITNLIDYINQSNILAGRIQELRENIQEKINNKVIYIEEKNMTYTLHPQDFDCRGNFEFRKGKEWKRGNLTYKQPSAPWIRIGLNVRERYPNDGWLEMDGNKNEWAVAFHGVGFSPQFALPKILVEGLRIGDRQLYRKKVGVGVYCTPDISVAERYASPVEIDGETYIYVFQCRVKPNKVKVADKSRKYWVINDPECIRPYGICIKKIPNQQSRIGKMSNLYLKNCQRNSAFMFDCFYSSIFPPWLQDYFFQTVRYNFSAAMIPCF